MSFRDYLVCFAVFVGMTLQALRFLLPNPNCSRRVCLATRFAAVLIFFILLTTSPFSVTTSSNKSDPRNLQLGRYIYAKGEFRFSQEFVQVHRIPTRVVDQYLYRMDSLLVLKQPSSNVLDMVRNETWRIF